MATRVLVFAADGTPLHGLDCHHGETMAARWVDSVLAALAAAGVEAIVVECTPAEGGDAWRHGIVDHIDRLRLETHTRPDGAREVVGLHRFPRLRPDQDARAAPGGNPFLTLREHASLPDRVPATLRLVAAPAEIVGERAPIRVRRGRMNPEPGAPATPAEARLRRRAAKARARP